MPFSIKWNDELDFDTIMIEAEEDMAIKELINVGKYELADYRATISEIREVPNSPKYFGGVVATKGITSKLKESRKLTIRFLKGENLIHEEMLEARILLRARADNIWVSFMNQPIEVSELRLKLREAMGRSAGYPQLLMRVGYGRDVKPTPRRDVDEVIVR